MAEKSAQSHSPDYDNPPVVETILGVQFDRLDGCSNGHLGAFWKTLPQSEWPEAEDAPPLPAQVEEFTGTWAKALKLQVTQDPSCRLRIRNSDRDRMIQVQNGRLHFNWLGKDAPHYPRYKAIRPEFVAALERFQAFVCDESLGKFRPNQWEVTYVNQIPRGTVWNTPADWGFFSPLRSVPTVASVIAGESFSGEWHFVIPENRGRLHVQWQHGKEVIDEPDRESNDFVRLTLTARGRIGEGGDPVLDGIDLGRKTIVRSFSELMSDNANEYWGIKK